MKILKELGEGSFGTTYLVESVNGDKYVLKVPMKNDQEAQNQAVQERTVLKHIKKHCKQYLICISKIKVEGGPSGIYLKYVPNTFELFSYLDKNNKLTVYTRFIIMKRLLEGMTLLHGLGVVHRDIKPENVLLEPNKLEIHYIDYGISCLKNNRYCQTVSAGTLDYLSPELARQENRGENAWNVCKAGDVWALGVLFVDLCYLGTQERSMGELASLTNDKVKRQLLRKIPQHARTIENQALITMCLFMLETDWKKRPTAKQALHILNTQIVNDLADVSGYSPSEIEDVANKYALAVKTNKDTEIFPRGGRKRRSTI